MTINYHNDTYHSADISEQMSNVSGSKYYPGIFLDLLW
jgi:hypothetical protein